MRNRRIEKFRFSRQLLMPWHRGVTISTGRAAEMLGVSPTTVLRMLQGRQIDGYKMSERKPNSPYKVFRDSVVRVIDSLRRRATVEGASSVIEVAEVLGCSEATVIRFIRDGLLEAYKMRDTAGGNSPYRVLNGSVKKLAESWKSQFS